MPRTFRDAITITRALNIPYLWIDSLCIIQDDTDDWEAESAKMANIYWNSYITIAADKANDASGGIFPADREKQVLVDEIMRDINDIDVVVEPGLSIRVRTLPVEEFSKTLHSNLCPTKREPPPTFLDSRAWVLQERILSRRSLIFGREISFACRSSDVESPPCECELRGREHLGLPLVLQAAADENSSALKRVEGPWLVRRNWEQLVADFTKREITHDSDRLPAISAIAAAMGRPHQNYLAGLWKEEIHQQLLWSLSNDGACRYSRYYAPSWSWASISGHISFPSLEHDESFWKICEASCTPSGRNPYGNVSGGHLVISGLITAASAHVQHENDTMHAWSVTVTLDERDDASGPEFYLFGRPDYRNRFLGLALRRSTSHSAAYERVGLVTVEDQITLYHWYTTYNFDPDEAAITIPSEDCLYSWNPQLERRKIRLV